MSLYICVHLLYFHSLYSIQSEALKRPCEGDFQKSEDDSVPPAQATISVHPDQLHPRYLPPPTDPHHNAVLLPLLCWNLRSHQRNSPGYKPSHVSGCGISDWQAESINLHWNIYMLCGKSVNIGIELWWFIIVDLLYLTLIARFSHYLLDLAYTIPSVIHLLFAFFF